MINYLGQMFEDDDDIAIVRIYFDHKQDYRDEAILRTILKQLSQRRESQVSDELRRLYRRLAPNDCKPSQSEVSEMLKRELAHFSKVFVILDALDERSERLNTGETILQELAKLQPTLHLMVTGRPFAGAQMSVFPRHETLEIQTADSDMEKFVLGEIEKDNTLRKGGDELRRLIVETVLDKARGMYRPLPQNSGFWLT